MDKITNKLNLKKIDLLDKLIEPSKEMEKHLKEIFGLKFKGNKDWKYEAPYWILNESLKTYSSISFGNNEDDKYNSLVVIDYDVCGVKIFMGSSTGNMLVDRIESIEALFKNVKVIIASHCEDDYMIARNLEKYKQQYGENYFSKIEKSLATTA